MYSEVMLKLLKKKNKNKRVCNSVTMEGPGLMSVTGFLPELALELLQKQAWLCAVAAGLNSRPWESYMQVE